MMPPSKIYPPFPYHVIFRRMYYICNLRAIVLRVESGQLDQYQRFPRHVALKAARTLSSFHLELTYLNNLRNSSSVEKLTLYTS